MKRPLRVWIVWHGLPAYAARLIRTVVGTPGIVLDVFATRSPQDPNYIEQTLGQPVHWIDDHSQPPPKSSDHVDVCIITGWAFEVCNRFAQAARTRGGRIVSMIDNRWRGDLRQRLGASYFQMFLSRKIHYAWVPGGSAAQLCRRFGMLDDSVFEGLYGGDCDLFTPGPPGLRLPRIGFVGQFIHRKGFDLLVSTFQQLRKELPEFELHLYGQGELSSLASDMEGVVSHPFASPDVIATAMQTFRVFVMPSRDDNWPLALHEAALAGCTLLTTDHVGNAVELVSEANGIVVKSGNRDQLLSALRTLANWPAERHATASIVSRKRAEPYGPCRWRREFLRLCEASTGGRWIPEAGVITDACKPY